MIGGKQQISIGNGCQYECKSLNVPFPGKLTQNKKYGEKIVYINTKMILNFEKVFL